MWVGEYECAEAYASWVISRSLWESLKSHPETPAVMRLPLSDEGGEVGQGGGRQLLSRGLPRTPRVTLRKKVPGEYGAVRLVATELIVVVPRAN